MFGRAHCRGSVFSRHCFRAEPARAAAPQPGKGKTAGRRPGRRSESRRPKPRRSTRRPQSRRSTRRSEPRRSDRRSESWRSARRTESPRGAAATTRESAGARPCRCGARAARSGPRPWACARGTPAELSVPRPGPLEAAPAVPQLSRSRQPGSPSALCSRRLFPPYLYSLFHAGSTGPPRLPAPCSARLRNRLLSGLRRRVRPCNIFHPESGRFIDLSIRLSGDLG